MHFHEFQAKELLHKYEIPSPEFYVFSTLKELRQILDQTGWTKAVLKVQVHAGGRGKAGGVKVATSVNDILATAKELLGKKIVNEQTGTAGLVSRQLLISSIASIQQEYYLALTISRELARIILIASPVGGMNIEQVAQEQPDQVLILPLPLDHVFRPYHLLRLTKFMSWEEKMSAQQAKNLISNLVRAFLENDAVLLEINPLIKTTQNQLMALDAKLSIDENALYRQPEFAAIFDVSQIPENEASAQREGLAYISLRGNIGCMVNGAGLAMATMDIINYYGGEAANFLDVGGGASQEKITEGFRIILADPKVKVILINIFGGIMNCEVLAAGIISAAKQFEIHVPLVVRLEGTHAEQGREMLRGLNMYIAEDLQTATQCAVELAKEG